jgi:hypothetical protein
LIEIQQSLHADREAESRDVGSPQETNEAVVAPAGADGALGSPLLGLHFEDGAGVVVQATHQAMVDPERHSQRLQVALELGEVVGALRAEMV